jgi:uncharacterized membrane protein
MTREEIENCWKDPQNWKWRVYYFKADPRVVVPRRLKWMGWTVNFARPSAIPLVGLIVVVVSVPLRVMIAKGAATSILLVTLGAAIAVVCFLCAWLSSRTK